MARQAAGRAAGCLGGGGAAPDTLGAASAHTRQNGPQFPKHHHRPRSRTVPLLRIPGCGALACAAIVMPAITGRADESRPCGGFRAGSGEPNAPRRVSCHLEHSEKPPDRCFNGCSRRRGSEACPVGFSQTIRAFSRHPTAIRVTALEPPGSVGRPQAARKHPQIQSKDALLVNALNRPASGPRHRGRTRQLRESEGVRWGCLVMRRRASNTLSSAFPDAAPLSAANRGRRGMGV